MSLTIDQVLCGLRMRESGGDYRAQNPNTSASGAYQYIDSTWGGYAGYSRAAQAPPAVQDQRARADRLAAWRRYGDWEKVVADHIYPAWAGDKSLWDRIPAPHNPTIRSFVTDVLAYAQADVCGAYAPAADRLGLTSPLVLAAVALVLLVGVGLIATE